MLYSPSPTSHTDKKQLICLLSTTCLLHSLRSFQVHLIITSHHIDLLLFLSLFLSLFLLLLLLPSSFPSSFHPQPLPHGFPTAPNPRNYEFCGGY